MFNKKQPPVAPQSRERTRPISSQRNTAVFSYHANRAAAMQGRERISTANQQEQSKSKQNRLPRGIKRIKIRHVLSAVAIFALFILSIGLQSTPKIVIVGEPSDRFILADQKVYQHAAQQLFAKSVTNNNKLTIDSTHVATSLEDQFSELRTVSVSLPFFGRQPIVYIQPAQVKMILATSSGQFVVDSSGRALTKLVPGTTLPKSRVVPVVQDQSGIPVKEGDLVLPSHSVSFVSEVTGQLQSKGIGIESWTLPAGASELDVRVAGTPYFVKFNLQGSAREQAGAFLATKQHLEASGVTPSKYYDVRVAGRAYYL